MELNGGSLVLRVQLVEKVRRPSMNAGFRIAYLDLVDERRTGEAEPYLAREHIRAHDFDERGYLFMRSEKPAFDGCSGATLCGAPGRLYAAIPHREPMLLCKFRSTAGGDIAQDSMKKRSNFLFGDPGCNS
ncbi:hypothetical protein NKH82_32150 [Mesorhizobium sp. M0915]|uniref:hypothetical protein n=1 Tax=Mesorhizobium sp. M0915 TaxID=2957027 RepID=UPI00333CD015